MTDPVALQTVLELDDDALRRILAEEEGRRDLRARFERFHAANPFVYDQLVKLARRARLHGHERIGISMLFEVLRYEVLTSRDPREDFRLDNGYRSFYSRMIMEQEEDLEGIFVTRRGPWHDDEEEAT